MSNVICITADKQFELVREAHRNSVGAFPEFMYHNQIINDYWEELYNLFKRYQYVLCDPKDDSVLALGNSFPLFWEEPFTKLPDDGIEWALKTAVEQASADLKPNVLCAFQIIVDEESRGQGLSYKAVEAMIDIADRNLFRSLVAPVRPIDKVEFPMMTMEDYIDLKNEDSSIFDDWIRVHLKMGGQLARICHRSFTVEASIEEWEEWTEMTFPESGQNVIPGGIAPLYIDRPAGSGLYIEPNIWIHHKIKPNH